MSRKSRIAISLIIAALATLSLVVAPAALAKSTPRSKVVRCTVVYRAPHYDIVRHRSHRFAVRHGSRKVFVHDVERYSVVKRTRHYVYLRAVVRRVPSTPTILTPNSGTFARGTTPTVTWNMSSAVSSGRFRVSLTSTASGIKADLPTGNVSAVRGATSYSVPWNVTQSLGTYRLGVSYYEQDGKLIGSDVSTDTLGITSAPIPTPTVTPTPVPAPTSDPIAAIKAARAGDTVSVAAGTFTGSVDVPDGVTVVGAGKDASWLKGRLTFGSSVVVRDLKIGDAGMSAVHNRSGATNTVFERCRFRGGSGRAYTYVVDLGSGAACNHITFKDCEVERNLGVESGGDQGFNNICVWVAQSGPVSDITFDGCHIGVSNGQGGHDTGSPRFDIECYTDTSPMAHGWQNITLRNCILEAADMETADFADYSQARASGVLIDGCTFKGGGYNATKWQNVLNFEMPLGVVVRNNVFQRGLGRRGYVLNVTDDGTKGGSGPGAVFTGNTFNLDTDDGIAPDLSGWPIVLMGYDNQFTNNTVNCHYGSNPILLLDRAYRNTVTGNTFNIGSRSSVSAINGSSGNTISSNTVN